MFRYFLSFALFLLGSCVVQNSENIRETPDRAIPTERNTLAQEESNEASTSYFTGEWVRYSIGNTAQSGSEISGVFEVHMGGASNFEGWMDRDCSEIKIFCRKYTKYNNEDYHHQDGWYNALILSNLNFSGSSLQDTIHTSIQGGSDTDIQTPGVTVLNHTRNIHPINSIITHQGNMGWLGEDQESLVPLILNETGMISSFTIDGGTGAYTQIQSEFSTPSLVGIEIDISDLALGAYPGIFDIYTPFDTSRIEAYSENVPDSGILFTPSNGLTCPSSHMRQLHISPENLKKYPIIRISYK